MTDDKLRNLGVLAVHGFTFQINIDRACEVFKSKYPKKCALVLSYIVIEFSLTCLQIKSGFNLQKFNSNCRNLQKGIECSKGVQESAVPTSSANLQEEKVLGVVWDSQNDCLLFNLSELSTTAEQLQPTKKNIVSLIRRFYDPIGFLAPIIIKYKILFQKLRQSKAEWNSDLPEGLLRDWNSLLFELKEAVPLSLPCRYMYHRRV